VKTLQDLSTRHDLFERKARAQPAANLTHVVKWAHANCRQAMQAILMDLEGNPTIFRGIPPYESTNPTLVRIVDTHRTARPARNTSDLYRCLIDYANPSWPNRSHSAICSYQRGRASNYGHLGCIVPADDAKCASTLETVGDFWELGVTTVNTFVSSLHTHDWENRPATPGMRKSRDGYRSGITSVGEWNKYAEALRTHVNRNNNFSMGAPIDDGVYHDQDMWNALWEWFSGGKDSTKPFMDAMAPHASLDSRKAVNFANSVECLSSKNRYGEVWIEGKLLWVPATEWNNFITAYGSEWGYM
jgi:hypothetical protein